MRTPRVLVFVDESNVVSSVRALGRKLDWLKLRDHLASADRGRELIEMVIYAGLPPPIPEWQTEREKKNKFLHWLRSNGFLVVAKDGSPGDGKHYKANVDVLMAIDTVELSVEIRPDVVVLVTGDADFAHLALQLRRRGIRVEVAATAQTLGTGLKGAANEVIDLVPLFLSGFLLHASLYLGFVRLSGCLPFFLLVRSQDAVDIGDVLLPQLYDLRLFRGLIQRGIVFNGLEVGNMLVNNRLSLLLLIGAETDLVV